MSQPKSILLTTNRMDLIVLFSSRITRNFAAGALAVAIPLYYKDELNLSYFLIGLLFAAGALTAPILSYLFGILGDLYGRKKVLIMALTLLPFSIIILLQTTYYPFLLIATALGGFGIAGGIVGGGVGAFVAPMQTALLAEKTKKENRTTIYTAFTMSANLSGSIGALILAIFINYQELFYITLVFALISVIIVLPLKETFKPELKEKRFLLSGNTTIKDKETIKKFVITGIFNGLSQGLVTPFLPIIFEENFHLTTPQIGSVIAIGGVLTTIIMIGTPYLTRKLGFVNFIMLSRAVSAIFVLFFPFSPSATFATFSYWIFTITRAIGLPSQQALMMNMVSERARSEASGTNQAARLFPIAVSTSFSGDILDSLPLYVSFGLAFILNICNIGLYQKFFGNIELDEKKTRIGMTAS